MDTASRLNLFIQRADELRQCRALKTGFRNRLTLEADQGGVLRVTREDEPDNDDLRSLLVTLRKFTMLNDSPIFLNRVLNVCEEAASDDELRRRVREAREVWKQIRRGVWMGLEIDGKQVTPEEAADLFINGRLFHDDPEKEHIFTQMSRGPLSPALIRHQFLDYVVDSTRLVVVMANIIKDGLSRNLFDLTASTLRRP